MSAQSLEAPLPFEGKTSTREAQCLDHYTWRFYPNKEVLLGRWVNMLKPETKTTLTSKGIICSNVALSGLP